MMTLQFPFWIVSDAKNVELPPEHTPCNAPSAAHTFTTPALLIEYLGSRARGSFTINLVSDYMAFVMVIADLHDYEIKELCVDPASNGSGGELVLVSDLMGQFAFR